MLKSFHGERMVHFMVFRSQTHIRHLSVSKVAVQRFTKHKGVSVSVTVCDRGITIQR